MSQQVEGAYISRIVNERFLHVYRTLARLLPYAARRPGGVTRPGDPVLGEVLPADGTRDEVGRVEEA